MKIEERDQRLEQALRSWEDNAFADRMTSQSALLWPEVAGQALSPNWAQNTQIFSLDQINAVRQRLLHAVTETSDTGLLQRGMFPDDDPMTAVGLLWGLYGWCRSSRRIYWMPADLQLLLQATSLRGFWDGIRLPFNAFAINLEEPLEAEGILYDTILFHAYGAEDQRSYCLVLLPQQLGSYLPIDQLMRRRILQAIQRHNRVKLGRLLHGVYVRRIPIPQPFFVESVPPEEVPPGTRVVQGRIDLVIQRMEEQLLGQGLGEFGRILLIAFRLVFGLTFYLQTLPTRERLPDPGLRPLTRPSPLRVVTQEAQVCVVQNLHVLTDEERIILRDYVHHIGKEMSPHFREGYYSRPSGLGHDPNADKSVWHRPTIVRRDLLPEGTLPYGSKSVIE